VRASAKIPRSIINAFIIRALYRGVSGGSRTAKGARIGGGVRHEKRHQRKQTARGWRRGKNEEYRQSVKAAAAASGAGVRRRRRGPFFAFSIYYQLADVSRVERSSWAGGASRNNRGAGERPAKTSAVCFSCAISS